MRKRTLWICGYPWEVRLTDNQLTSSDRIVHGITDKPGRKIWVSRYGASAEHIRSTLIHESLHACLNTVANGCPDDEETVVQALECGLYSMIADRRNRWFWQEIGLCTRE